MRQPTSAQRAVLSPPSIRQRHCGRILEVSSFDCCGPRERLRAVSRGTPAAGPRMRRACARRRERRVAHPLSCAPPTTTPPQLKISIPRSKALLGARLVRTLRLLPFDDLTMSKLLEDYPMNDTSPASQTPRYTVSRLVSSSKPSRLFSRRIRLAHR